MQISAKICSGLALVFTLVLSVYAQPHNSEKLLPFTEHKKWGFINTNGDVVIKPQFDYVRDFSDGLSAVRIDRKWGYIDATGKWIVEPKYELAQQFAEGRAQVRTGGMWSSEPVYLIGGETFYIDKSGSVIFKLLRSPLGTSYDDYTFSEGLLSVQLDHGYGYLDTSGKTSIEGRFDYAGDFSEGVAGVWVGNNIGYVDQQGKFVIPPEYPIAGWGHPNPCTEGIIAIPMGGMMGYLDKSGKIAISRRFYHADIFSEGLSAVQPTEKKYIHGYIDKSGRMVIEPKFDVARRFSEGLAAVRVNDKWGYIDKNGKWAIKPRFTEAKGFSGGVAYIRTITQWGYITKSGVYIWLSQK
ncbi:MAG: WG repeat-containing protein [Pyrinomonadaceae bacterium]